MKLDYNGMQRKMSDLKSNVIPKIHTSGDEGLEKVVAKIEKSDWRDRIMVPMPKFYFPDEDWMGKKVTLHMCEFHEDWNVPEYDRKEVSLTGNCNCSLKGKEVTITKLKQTSRARFYRSTCYTIAELPNLIHESEFSPESLDKRQVTTGYIIEGKKNHFLTAGFINYINKKEALEGYMHNTGIVKLLLKGEIPLSNIPKRAYPAECGWEGENKRVVGEALSWEQLREKILVR